jgi:hypothetical protein
MASPRSNEGIFAKAGSRGRPTYPDQIGYCRSDTVYVIYSAPNMPTATARNERRDINQPCLCVYGTHGVEPRGLAASMVRLGNAEPASIIGVVIDLTAAVGLVIRGKAGEASI